MQPTRSIMICSTLLFAIATHSFAQQIYIANEPLEKLEKLDFTSGLITTLCNIGAKPDDLVLNSQGQLIYSVGGPQGTVYLFDPVTGSDTVLVSGVPYARDLTIEPGGASMLISLYAQGKIVRFSFTTGATTVLFKKKGTVDGTTYDASGNLFAVVNHNTVAQIDPVTGAILKTLVLEPHVGVNGGDGMTFDSFTGQLWISHDGKLATGQEGGLIEVPTDLSGFTLYQTGKISFPDGIKSDGKGNLYIGALWTAIQYNIPSDTVVKNIVVKGADGVALVPGTY